jgi:LCP family protein required for cell wall assembly
MKKIIPTIENYCHLKCSLFYTKEVSLLNNRKKNVITNKRTSSSKRSTLSKQTSSPQPTKSQQQSSGPNKKTISRSKASVKSKQKKRAPKRFFKTLLLLVLILSVTAFAVNALFLSNVTSGLSGSLNRYGISNSAANFAKQHKIVNIAIFGIDGRDDVEGDRTDTIMIATADYEHNKIKVTSLMRDTYVSINDKYDYDKLNAAYAYGGPTLALQTINKNFDTAITDYVTIDFNAMVSMVNAVNGVSINIKTYDELEWVNEYLNDVNEKVNTGSPQLNDIGEQFVDGSQALAYCRVRYVGDGDFDRTLRQREVFEQVLSKALDLNLMDQYNLLTATLPYVETSLSTLEIIKYAGNLALMPSHAIEQARFPDSDYLLLDTLHGISYVIPDTLVDNITTLYQFIFEETYTPSTTANEISDEINDTLYGNDSYDNSYDNSYDDSYDD